MFNEQNISSLASLQQPNSQATFAPNGPGSTPNRPSKTTYEQGITNNFWWSRTIVHTQPDFFPTLAAGQKPQILWFGCSDSRVPETTIMQLKHGDVFTHRSIANQIIPGEASTSSVLNYAVQHLHDDAGAHAIKDIVVCGHTNCGGCAAALDDTTDNGGPIDQWLTPLRALRATIASGWTSTTPKMQKINDLVKANIHKGVESVLANSEVAEGVEQGKLRVHAVLYHLEDGSLEELPAVI